MIKKTLIFFLISGLKEYKNNWRIIETPPAKISDKLTVQNYFGGLEEIKNAKIDLFDFRGTILFDEINLVYEGNDTILLSASVKDKQSSEYCLEVSLLHQQKGCAYHAKSYRRNIQFDNIFTKFMGPNTK